MTTVSKRDYYEVLGIDQGAGDAEIKSAYRRLALKFHPDKNPGSQEAVERFKEAAEAYEVLSHPDKRSRYDQFGHGGLDGQAGFGSIGDILSAFGDILGGDVFSSFFGGAGGRRQGPPRGRSLEARLDLTFAEMAEGTSRTLTIRRRERCEECGGGGSKGGRPPVTCGRCRGSGHETLQQGFFAVRRACAGCGGEGIVIDDPCPTCDGHGLQAKQREVPITVPPGIEDGVVLNVRGEGEAGPRGGPAGDLHCIVRVEEHDLFLRSPRDPADLFVEVPVPVSMALLGGKIEVPTLTGMERLTLSAGTEPGSQFRVRGAGLPRLEAAGRRPGHGDLYVRIAYDVHGRPSRKLKKALEGLAEIETKERGTARKRYTNLVDQHKQRCDDSRKSKE